MLSARDQNLTNVMAYHKAKYHDKIHDRLLAYIRYDYGRSGRLDTDLNLEFF